jgi:hypothetical protein
MGLNIQSNNMEKSQITLTRSEAKEIRNHLYQTASDLTLLSQFVKGGLGRSLLIEASTIKNIAKAINERIQTEVTFTLYLE